MRARTFQRSAKSEDSACSNSKKIYVFLNFPLNFPFPNVLEQQKSEIYEFPGECKSEKKPIDRFSARVFLFAKHSISRSLVKIVINRHT